MHNEPAHEFANIGAQLLQPGPHRKSCAVTNVDPLGVIERFTFAEIAREAALWASLARQHELEPGDRVLVLAGPAWEWRCALLGIQYAGGVAVPCPDSTPVAELRAIAADAGATLVVSIRARPDLVEQEGPRVLTAEQLETIDAAESMGQPGHQSLPGDGAIILYARTAGGLRGAVHTHASLAAQADSGEHWLGVGKDERVWCTATDGSAGSIWLLLAAWREHADIVNVNLELDPDGQLELLDRLRPSAVWLSDEEYGVLASAVVPSWIDLGSIRRALASEESSAGATAFGDASGAKVTPLIGLNEVGIVAGWPAGMEENAVDATAMPVPGIPLAIVDEQGKELPADRVGNVVVRGDAPSLCSGYASGETKRRDSWFHLQCRGALGSDNSLRLATRPPLEIELVEAEVEMPGAELVEEAALEEIADEPEPTSWRSRREAKRARRGEEREAKERRKAEERRRREEDKNRELAERAEATEREAEESAEDEKRRESERLADEREQAEAEERARREAAKAEERRRAEEAARAEERRREEEERQRERELAKERAEADAEEQARREAAEAEKRRRAEEAVLAEARRREEEEKQRERERLRQEEEARRREEQLAKERAKAETEERARREAAEAEVRRRAEERRREEEEKQREQERLAEEREQAEAAERARREAAEAEERRRAEEAARAEERRRDEEEKQRERERLRQEQEARRREEQLAKERAKAEAEERDRREAAEAEERRRSEEAARAEERQREEEEKQRERERRREEKEARRREERQAKEAAHAQRKTARLGRRRRSKSEPHENARPEAEPEHLTADILSGISQYGIKASPLTPDARPEAEAPTEPRSPAEPTERRDAQ